MQLSPISLALTRAGASSSLNPASLFSDVAGRSGVSYTSADGGVSWDALIEQNESALGQELVTNAISQWNLPGNATVTELGGGRWRLTANAAGTVGYIMTSARPTSTAFCSVILTANSHNRNVQFYGRNQAMTSQNLPTLGKRITATIGPGSTELFSCFIVASAAGEYVEFEAVSVKEITDWNKLQLFADANGTDPIFSPVTASKGWGLLLDRSKKLVRGTDLVINSDFSSSTGWTTDAGWSIAGGKATAAAAANGTGVYRTGAFVVGNWYSVEVTISDYVSGAGIFTFFNANNSPSFTANGVYRFVLQCTSAAGLAGVAAVGSSSFAVDAISVKELPGNHAIQPTASARGEFSRRYNLLVGTDSNIVSESGWAGSNVAGVLQPDGSSLVSRVSTASGGFAVKGIDAGVMPIGTKFTLSLAVKSAGVSQYYGLRVQGTYPDRADLVVDLSTGLLVGVGTGTSYTDVSGSVSQPDADGFIRITLSGTVAVSQVTSVLHGPAAASGGIYGWEGASAVPEAAYAKKPDLRLTADVIPSIPAYQRVTSDTDYEEVGFPCYHRIDPGDFTYFHANPAGASKAVLVWAGQDLASQDWSRPIEFASAVGGGAEYTNGLMMGLGNSDFLYVSSRGTAVAYAHTTVSAVPPSTRLCARSRSSLADEF